MSNDPAYVEWGLDQKHCHIHAEEEIMTVGINFHLNLDDEYGIGKYYTYSDTISPNDAVDVDARGAYAVIRLVDKQQNSLTLFLNRTQVSQLALYLDSVGAAMDEKVGLEVANA